MSERQLLEINDDLRIAVVGMACRFPGAANPDEFWHNLRAGVESIQFPDAEALMALGANEADLSNPNFVGAISTPSDLDHFDAGFFDFTFREAEILDPQHRLFLECAYEALEGAGYCSDYENGLVGVYGGAGSSIYLHNNLHRNPNILDSVSPFELSISNNKDYLPTRTSYKLNLCGPSVNVNTACSTSLVAIHLACQALLNGECDLALAGGASMGVQAGIGYIHQEGMIFSSDGHCRAFDSEASGTIFGAGAGTVLLKRYEEAVADGDIIHAVVRGSAINNDGALKAGYAAPSIEGQATVITLAYLMADIDPESVSYIETHGTGTQMGDPIEIKALTEAFRDLGDQRHSHCPIGSVKTNIGHLDAAAGIAGFIKTVLSLKHQQIPPSLHFTTTNPNIDFNSTPFYVNTALTQWPATGTPRRAGISAFGIGGTNAHIIIEEAPTPPATVESDAFQLLLLSAKTEQALDHMTANLATHLRQNPSLNLADVAYTLQIGRPALPQRRMFVCQQKMAVPELLGDFQQRTTVRAQSEAPSLAFMFSGQGTQYVTMGMGLYTSEPLFREQIDYCAKQLIPHLGLDIRDLLFADESTRAHATQQLHQTAITQPVLFTFEYALAQLWIAWGVRPDVMIGHSIGEYVAACLAEVMTLDDALALVAARGRLMQALPSGAMLSVPLSEQEIAPFLNEQLSLAALNAPSFSVVSGSTQAIDTFQAEIAHHLAALGLTAYRLHTSHAFHSAMMEPMLDPFRAYLEQVKLKPPVLPFISNVSGTWIRDDEATDPAYWVQHVRQAVRFSDGLGLLYQGGTQTLLEVGPGRTLCTLARQHPSKHADHLIIGSIRHPQDTQWDDEAFLLTTLGKLWQRGVAVDWTAFTDHKQRQRLALPTYPFERQRYWIEPTTEMPMTSRTQGMLENLSDNVGSRKKDVADWFYIPTWNRSVISTFSQENRETTTNYLLFLDEHGLGAALAVQLADIGHTVITVQAQGEYSQLNSHCYSLDPQNAEHYDRLFQTLASEGHLPQSIVHLWNISEKQDTVLYPTATEQGAQIGFISLLYMVQALGRQESAPDALAEKQLFVLSNNMQSVTGTEPLHPEKALLLGFLKVIPLEYPHMSCRSIDLLLPPRQSRQEENLVQQLMAEINSETKLDPATSSVAYRGIHRLVQRYEPTTLPEREGPPALLRTNGVYLITGGLGGIGLTTAHYLAEKTQAKLILTGRSPLLPRAEWQRTHPQKEQVSTLIEQIEQLEALGAEVLYISADVTDLVQMEAVVKQAVDQFGTIHGVLHTAGLSGGAALQQKTVADVDRILGPKVQGSLVLDAILQNLELDFFLLYSSLAAIEGIWGGAEYAAANAFLDAFAHYRTARDGQLTIAANWDSWREVGMAADLASSSTGLMAEGISPQEGSLALDYILAANVPQIVITPRTPFRPQAQDLAEPQSLSTYARPKLGHSYVPPATPTEEQLAEIWQRVLGVDQPGTHDDFFELGGHSLLVTQIAARIRETVGVEVPLKVLFELSTIAGLAQQIEQIQREQQEEEAFNIEPISRQQPPLLSFAQQRLWFLEQLDEGESTTYTLPMALQLSGPLDIAVLKASINEIVRRHETLRTNFSAMNGQPVLMIKPELVIELPAIATEQIEPFIAAEAQYSFDLSQDNLLRATLLAQSQDNYVLLVTIHHIIADGWSMGIFLHELGALYNAFLQGAPSPLPELSIQYADFAHWQRAWLSESKLASQLAYWKEKLADAPPLLALPTYQARPPIQTFNGARETFQIEPAVAQQLQTLGQQHGATLFMTLLTAFKILLARYSGMEDIVVGTPVANRPLYETELLMGFFVNNLVLRSNLAGNPTFQELLISVRQTALDAYAHQDIFFERLVSELQPERNLSYSSLYQVLFDLQNTPLEDLDLRHLEAKQLETNSAASAFDLALSLEERGDGLAGVCEYNTDLFEREAIINLTQHYVTLLRAIVQAPHQQLSEFSFLSAAERQQLLVDWNSTKTSYPDQTTIHTLIEAQAAQHPHAIAVTFGTESLTYQELMEQANRLAHYLQAQGIGPEVLVGICMNRSLDMIIGVLAILKAGGAYLPLDPEYSIERLHFMIADAALPLVLTHEELAYKLTTEGVRTLCLDSQAIETQPITPPLCDVGPENLVYTIYTSGSTGKPKGVQVNHRSLCNLITDQISRYELQPGCRLLKFLSLSFDAATSHLFMALCAGATLHLAESVDVLAPEALFDLLDTQAITHAPLPGPILARLPVADLPALKVIITGGDTCSAMLVERWATRVRFFNEYGPTETTVCATVAECVPDGKTPPLGRPIANTQIYLLDPLGQPVPVGVPGEIYIGGDGLARGYLNQPALTAQRFISHPFQNSTANDMNTRLYRTGDNARYRANGDIEFLGRVDNQVKIRGFRIELGEIEAVLGQHSTVQRAIVVVHATPDGDKRLVAYAVATGEASLQPGTLHDFLMNRLPRYMIPAAFVILDEFPLTLNGKIDLDRLPAPDMATDSATTAYVAPRTPIEATIAAIWAEQFHINTISVHDNFFTLGGHSLLVTQVASRLREKTQVDIPLRTFFAAPTIALLAEAVEEAQQDEANLVANAIIQIRNRDDELPLSFTQQRLWFLYQVEGANPTYNMPSIVALHGLLDIAALEKTLHGIVQRHEILRTSFPLKKGAPIQIIDPDGTLPFNLEDLQHLPAEAHQQVIESRALQENEHIFDIKTGPLIHATLLRFRPDYHVLCINMHHIVSDGWSIGVMFNELVQIYKAFATDSQRLQSPLPPLPIQYADFTVWQREWLQGTVLEQQLAYWRTKLSGIPARLELPTDRVRQPVQSFRGQTKYFTIDPSLADALQRFSQAEDVTLFMTLLAAYSCLLARYSGMTDITVGTPISNRNQLVIEDLIGFFANTLVLRTQLDPELTVRELVAQVRQTALDAYTHQDIPFEKLVEELQPERNLSYTPLFQVMFVLLNPPLDDLEMAGVTLTPLDTEGTTAKFDLTLFIQDQATSPDLVSKDEAAGELKGMWEYNSDLFDEQTIERMTGHLLTLLRTMIMRPEAPVATLPLLTAGEHQQLLHDWNKTEVAYPYDTTFHELFEAQVAQTPAAIAVSYRERQLTYQELNAQANRLAHALVDLGVGPNVVVALLAERSIDFLTAMLAVFKAGGAYLPLDPHHPASRHAQILDQSQSPLILITEPFAPQMADVMPLMTISPQICTISELLAGSQAIENLAPRSTPNDLVYVIFTSGSTGLPKGAMVEQRGMINHLYAKVLDLQLTEQDVVVQNSTQCFDISVWQFLVGLLVGSQVCVYPDEIAHDPVRLLSQAESDNVTVLEVVPSFLHIMLGEIDKMEQNQIGIPKPSLSMLRWLLVTGEALPPELCQAWFVHYPRIPMMNAYGPTECSDDVTHHIIKEPPADEVLRMPIGLALSNTQLYVLDGQLQPVPVGIPGELYVGGDGVGRGYLYSPARTADVFLPSPFSTEPGGRLYRTGDQVVYHEDGILEYIGRVDYQVKIHGFRIELGEIEAVLRQHPLVQNVVVQDHTDEDSSKYLAAYIVPVLDDIERAALNIQTLRSDLQEQLPNYMIPAAFVPMSTLPLTANGKIDRKALPIPGRQERALDSDSVMPQTKTEEQIAEIWQSALEVEQVGIHHNFFELGGHSLLLIQVHSQMRDHFGDRLSVVDLFQHPTVYDLAQFLTYQNGSSAVMETSQQQAAKRSTRQSAAEERRQRRRQSRVKG